MGIEKRLQLAYDLRNRPWRTISLSGVNGPDLEVEGGSTICSCLVPGSDRPHTGASGNVEHVMAYVLAAAVTRLAFPHVQSRWQIIAFSAASAVFEICQIWIPGRSAGIDNWLASSSGAVVGVVLVRAVLHERLRRWL